MRHFKLELVGGTAVTVNTGFSGRAAVCERDVRLEAQRRLSAAGYQQMRARELATGVVMPRAMRYLRMQMDFVAATLIRLPVIPDDFRSDAYWPATPARAARRADE